MRSLTFRLTLWYAFIVTMTVGMILWAGRFYLEGHILEGVDYINDAEFEEISHRLNVSGDDLPPADAIRHHTEIDASLFFFQVSSSDGKIIFRSSNMSGHSLPGEVHGSSHISIEDEELGHLRVGEYSYEGLDIHIASSLAGVDSIFADSLSVIFQILLIVFVVSLILGILLSRVALNPIRNIQSIARRISAHNLSERIPVPPGGDEVSELSKFLNEMFDRLEAAFGQVSRFTADASHELRTPLSLIRLHGETLIQNPDLPEKERLSSLTEQMAEIDRLNKLIDDLLLIAKADAGVFQLSLKSDQTHTFVEDFAEGARLLCEEQKLKFRIVLEGEAVLVSIDPSWMRHVLLNLLSNAMRISPADGLISLYSNTDGEGLWKLILEDDGPGLPEEALKWIFDRFHRHPSTAKMDNQEGTGLGLAICQSIVSKHGGRIFARNRQHHKGLQVHIEIPLN